MSWALPNNSWKKGKRVKTMPNTRFYWSKTTSSTAARFRVSLSNLTMIVKYAPTATRLFWLSSVALKTTSPCTSSSWWTIACPSATESRQRWPSAIWSPSSTLMASYRKFGPWSAAWPPIKNYTIKWKPRKPEWISRLSSQYSRNPPKWSFPRLACSETRPKMHLIIPL